MTTTYLFANNASSDLAAPISSSDTTLSVTAGTGVRFPNPAVGQAFTVTLNDQATGDIYEIMLCTGRTGDVLTVVRAQEGTSAQSWTAGDFVANFITAGTATIFVQGGALGTMSSQNANAVAIIGGAIHGVTLASTRGNTAARPTPPPFLGCQYFDTDLGQPIWASSIGPNLWVNAAGVSV